MKEHLDSARRIMTMSRLEMEKLCSFLGRDPWEKVTNAAYDSCFDTSVTVVITLFNYSEYICECLDSVCAAKADMPGGFEVLVIDDCSTDSSASVVKQYIQTTDTPICLVKKLFNTGLADARNVGLRLARSPYIFILDADNWIYPNCLSKLYSAIHESEHASVYGIINKFNSQTGEGQGLISSYEWDVKELLRAPFIDAMAMFRCEALLEVGGYSTDLMELGWCGWEDYDMWLKFAQAGYVCKCLPQVLSAYRTHPHSMIYVTAHYSVFLARQFVRRYADLVEQYDQNSPVLFGTPRHEIFASPVPSSQIPSLQLQAVDHSQEINELKEKLKRARANVKRMKHELEQAQHQIATMQNSKFWQLKKSWSRLKQFLRLASEDE